MQEFVDQSVLVSYSHLLKRSLLRTGIICTKDVLANWEQHRANVFRSSRQSGSWFELVCQLSNHLTTMFAQNAAFHVFGGLAKNGLIAVV